MQPSIDPVRAEWRAALAPFERSSLARSIDQLAASVLPTLLLWAAILLSLRVSDWLTLPLAVIAAGFLARSFIISHDCGHGAFFRSRRANRVVGYVTGPIAFLPSTGWPTASSGIPSRSWAWVRFSSSCSTTGSGIGVRVRRRAGARSGRISASPRSSSRPA